MWKYVTFPGTRGRICLMGLILTLTGVMPLNFAFAAELRSIELELGERTYRIELAETSSQRRLGLMYREVLAADAGMLLVYPNSGKRGIWMKNVRIPLRVYWINSDFEVVEIRLLEPCREDPCPVYTSSYPARYVLELDGGEHPIELGDRLSGLSDL